MVALNDEDNNNLIKISAQIKLNYLQYSETIQHNPISLKIGIIMIPSTS